MQISAVPRGPVVRKSVIDPPSLAVAVVVIGLAACGGGNQWAAADTTDMTHTLQTSRDCTALCLSDAGCSPQQAAGCFEGMSCDMGSMLHRHGGPDVVSPDAGCSP